MPAAKPLSPKDLKARAEAAKKVKDGWLGTWRDAYRFTLPQRDIIDHPVAGQSKGTMVYDSTAIVSITHLANRVQQDAFPTFQTIMRLEPGPEIPEDQKSEVEAILKDASDAWHAALHKSNFSTSINEFLLEFAIGTGAMLFLEGEDFNPFHFVAVPTPTVSLEEGPWGGIGGIYRHDRPKARNVEAQWKGAKLPQDIRDKMKDDHDLEVRITEGTYKVDGVWFYDVILDDEQEGADGPVSLLPEPRVFEGLPPWIIARWSRTAGETFGRGPAIMALPDIRTVNKVVEFLLKHAAISMSPPMTAVDDGVLNPNTARIRPDTIIPVARNSGGNRGASLVPLDVGGRFDVGQLVIENLQIAIKRIFMDEQLPPAAGAVRSPTEIVERQRNLELDVGAAFGRIISELLQPLVFRGLEILNRKKIINFPFKVDSQFVRVAAVSPLAQRQDTEDLQADVDTVQIVSGLLGPEMAAFALKVEDIPGDIARKRGMNTDLIRDEAGRAQVQQIITSIIQQAMVAANPEAGVTANGIAASGALEDQPPQPAQAVA